jgi:segregation and condensation protein B
MVPDPTDVASLMPDELPLDAVDDETEDDERDEELDAEDDGEAITALPEDEDPDKS